MKINLSIPVLFIITLLATPVYSVNLLDNMGNEYSGELFELYEGTLKVKDSHGKTKVTLADLDEASQAIVNAWAEKNPSRVNISSRAEVKPVPVKTTKPVMLGDLKKLKGMVAVYAVIDENGNVVDAYINKTSDERLNDPALIALKKWRFKPAKKDGEKVKIKILIPFRFS